MGDINQHNTDSRGVSRRRFIAGTGSILGAVSLMRPRRRGPGSDRHGGLVDPFRSTCPGPGDRHRVRRLRRRPAPRPGGRRRADGRDGHGLGHPGLRRQDLRQHDQPGPAFVLAADQDQAASQQLPRLPHRQGHPPLHRDPGRRGDGPDHRVPGPRRRWRIARQRRYGGHPQAGELRRHPPVGKCRRDVRDLLSASQRRTRHRSHRPGLVRHHRLLPVRAGRPQAGPAFRFPLRLRARRLRLGLHEAGGRGHRHQVGARRGDPLRQQLRQEVAPEDLSRPGHGHRQGHHLTAAQGHFGLPRGRMAATPS